MAGQDGKQSYGGMPSLAEIVAGLRANQIALGGPGRRRLAAAGAGAAPGSPAVVSGPGGAVPGMEEVVRGQPRERGRNDMAMRLPEGVQLNAQPGGFSTGSAPLGDLPTVMYDRSRKQGENRLNDFVSQSPVMRAVDLALPQMGGAGGNVPGARPTTPVVNPQQQQLQYFMNQGMTFQQAMRRIQGGNLHDSAGNATTINQATQQVLGGSGG